MFSRPALAAAGQLSGSCVRFGVALNGGSRLRREVVTAGRATAPPGSSGTGAGLRGAAPVAPAA